MFRRGIKRKSIDFVEEGLRIKDKDESNFIVASFMMTMWGNTENRRPKLTEIEENLEKGAYRWMKTFDINID